MRRVFDIAAKDLLQLARDRKVFLFLLILPIFFTLLFGYAFGGFESGGGENRLPVGYLDEDRSWLSKSLGEMLSRSQVIRLEKGLLATRESLEWQVAEEKLAAAIIVPVGYGHAILHGKPGRLILVADTGLPAGKSAESEALTAALRVDSAARTAIILEQAASERAPFDYIFQQAMEGWEEPPIRVEKLRSAAANEVDQDNPLAHTSPGMMLQFGIASLLTSGQIIVEERKSRSLQRLLTTATPRAAILFGHYLAILVMVSSQILVLISFGWLFLKVDYLRAPDATLLVGLCSAACIAALGLLIGTAARSEEQARIFSLVPMFILAGLGGVWVPLELTGETFQMVGHLSPLAWAMDGFKNITIRGLGIESVWIPCAALLGYGALFFGLAIWRFRRE